MTDLSARGDGSARMACVLVPALPLQLVLRAHPEWRDEPVVVVEEDRPLSPVVWSNRAARTLRILPGLRFGQARALAARLHAEVVDQSRIDAAIDELFERLTAYSPRIEPVLVQHGLFFVDPEGLSGLFGDFASWASGVHGRLASDGFVAAVVVGFTRGASWAIASARASPWVVKDLAEERQLCGRVPLSRLGLPAALVSELALLGIDRVGQLLALPVAQLHTRYGPELARVHDFLSGKTWSAFLPRVPEPPLLLELEVEPPDDDLARLSFGIKAVLERASSRLREQHHGISALTLTLTLERGGRHGERVEAAAPTLDTVQLVELVRLRLASAALESRITYVVIELEHVRVHPRQLAFILPEGGSCEARRRRNPEAAERALARLRASYGADAVTRPRLLEAHLPEASFEFEPIAALTRPRATGLPTDPPLVRRLYGKPVLLDAESQDPERWLAEQGALDWHGPYRLAGGWWSSQGGHERDYCFVETRAGEIWWLFYDRLRRRWLLQGAVE